MTNSPKQITKIALLAIDDVRDTLLCVKKRGLDPWITPGGKLEAGESHHDCIYRELDEELGVGASFITIKKHFMTCEGIAEGTTDTHLTLICYIGRIRPHAMKPANEIEYYIHAPLHLYKSLPVAWALKNEIMPGLCNVFGIKHPEE